MIVLLFCIRLFRDFNYYELLISLSLKKHILWFNNQVGKIVFSEKKTLVMNYSTDIIIT